MVKEIGLDFELEVDARSKTNDGYIFYASAKTDFLSLYIKEGNVIAECNNGGGKFSVTVQPSSSICNGEFHSILLKKKSKTLILSVNGVMKTFTTTKKTTVANTNRPYYYGGMPKGEVLLLFLFLVSFQKLFQLNSLDCLGKTIFLSSNAQTSGKILIQSQQ